MLDRKTLYCVAAVLTYLLWPGTSLVAKDPPATAAAAGTTPPPAAKKTAKPATSAASAKNNPAAKNTPAKTAPASSAHRPAATSSANQKNAASKKKPPARRRTRYKPPTARSIKLTKAFLASAQLRPMAQQLAATRSPAAYAGVLTYARTHPGEGAAAAYLALGHAYMQDHRYAEAIADFTQAKRSGEALADYADYLAAQAAIQSGHSGDAYAFLVRFADRYPDSIFAATAPVQLASAHLQQDDAPGALQVLAPLANTPQSQPVDFRYTLARAYQLTGDAAHAAPIFRAIYAAQPFTFEASQSAAQLQAMGAPLSAAERKTNADALFNARRYGEAAAEYNALGRDNPQLAPADRDALTLYAAVCDFKLKELTRRDIERLPDTNDDTAALKLYMLAELSRNEDDRPAHDAIIAQMVARFPASRWLEEALYSGGNMYLLNHDAAQAIVHYSTLVRLFPNSTYAPSAHWRAAWMNYRTRNYAEAARLMDEQIARYPGGLEIPPALYWRGRIYEDEERNFPQAVNYYRRLSDVYADYYYAGLARQRLAVLGPQPAVAPAPALNSANPAPVPDLTGDLPENDTHLIKARLLANAALNEYIAPEIAASPTSSEWGALAQAEIYVSYGEFTRAIQSMKRSGISFFTLPMDQVPAIYWQLMFPQPYWKELVADSGANSLDPYLVASLIRQESEFNAGAISPANAYGLMQLLPSVGKSLAKKHGLKGFSTSQLLDPTINLELGTIYLKQAIDRYGGQLEYALAAYNAGDTPVRQWLASNDYKDVPEFVESIPYTETREYVQAILRNREIYRALYPIR
ncbi:MAG: transglycosylase SLT domain-containing protein [Acidobacteriaceae bacterium]